MSADRHTVLLVDDIADNIAVLATILAGRYRIRAATGGAQALAICRSADPPALVLLDVVMPGMDGYAVCRELKSDAATARIPVIFVSGNAGLEEEQCFEVGGADFVTKPVRVPVLLRRVETHLRLVEAERTIARLSAG